MKKTQRIRYLLAQAKRRFGAGANRNALWVQVARGYDMSTGGGPLRGLAMFSKQAKYW